MAALPPRSARSQPRPGSLLRPVNARLYRGTWLLVGIPLLVAAFSVAKPQGLRPAVPTLPPVFDRLAAVSLAQDLAQTYPDRFPGSSGAIGAAEWFQAKLAPYGFRVHHDRFSATVAGFGRLRLENLLAVAPGRSPQAIVVMANRDTLGTAPDVNDNASGVAALVELARSYARPVRQSGSGRLLGPAHTILFLATDGGALGGLGADRFARTYRGRVLAVVNLDSLAGDGPPRLVLTGSEPRSPAAGLVETAALRVREQTGARPVRARAISQLIDLGFPFSLYEQAPLVGRGISAVTLTTDGERPASPPTGGRLQANGRHLGELGRAAQELIRSLDQGIELAQGTSSYVYLGPRIVRGWAIELVLFGALLPFVIATVDLFARCRRRRIPLAPALRSFRSRFTFWLWTGILFELFALAGVWPDGAAAPLSPETRAAGHWPFLALAAMALLSGMGWLAARERLLPRRPVGAAEEVAGATAALLVLLVLSLVVVAMNPYALIFVLPSLHAWLWLPQLRARPAWVRLTVLATGFSGALLLVGSFAGRYGLGLDAPWYLLALVAVGYVKLPALLVTLVWLAAAGQLAALSVGRYAPYPSAAERPRLGPFRTVIRRLVLARRARRASRVEREALEG